MNNNILAVAIDTKDKAIRVKWDLTISQWDVDKILWATDLVQIFTYLDLGLTDERVETITYSSVSEWMSFVETFNYIGLPWSYTLNSITRA